MRSDKAFTLLQEAGITDSIDTFKSWLREGKIKSTGIFIDEYSLTQFIKHYKNPDKDLIINRLKAKIQAQSNHIIGIENLHDSTTSTLFKQKEQLNNEILLLKKENQKFQQEILDLLKENIALRDQLIQLKEHSFSKNQNSTKTPSTLPIDKQKLGLSKMASYQEIISTYKVLLKLSHPDHGGDARLFQYIKADFDHIRKQTK